MIVFEAQAGQGKTTVIKQFLDRLGGDSAWYQVTPEDADPANLLAALQACLSQGCPGQPEIADIPRWAAGDITSNNLPKHLARLLGQVRSHLANDLYLVFDDLHHLAGHEESVSLINHLIATAPPRLRFILSSREPVRLQALAHSGESARVARVGNRELALEDSEIADLFHQVFGGALSHSMIREISIKTDGWIMGALLFGLQMVSRGDGEPPGRWDGARCTDIRAYFRRKVFALLEPELRHPLLVLSLLEDIPVDLAAGLTGREDIHARLHQLAARNFFIRDLTPDSTVFGLHHLFRQFLRDRATQELAPETLRKVHRDAGAYYLRCNTPAQALRHYLKAGDLEAIDAALREQGPAMLAANQTATLSSILGSIPEQDLARLGWGCLFLALATMDSAPANALPLLRKALAVFAPAHDELGELVCLAHIISIHITTTGHSREGEQLLERAEELFQGLEGAMDSCTTILVARSMAMGRVIFLADVDTATRYADMAMSLAMKDHLVNFEAAMLMVMGYIKIFAGRLSMARQWMERAHEIVPRSEVGAFHCLAIRMMLMNFLFHDGCFDNYYTEKSQIVDAVGMDMFSQSIVGPFCHVWEMDIAINQGRFEEALRIAREADALSPHLKSQTLQLKAVVLALQGQTAEALAACDESTRLREQAGGLYFITLHKILVGLVHSFCGEYDIAVSMLTEGIRKARSMPTDYLESCGLMHRAATFLLRGECEAATADIRRGLGLMRRNDYKHFWAWTPGSMEQVLGFAVSRNIEPAYARKLAVERIRHDFTDQGESIPLLEIRCLGELAILFRGEPLLPPEALTPGQRELLCLLLASPDLKIPQDTACLHFWPDGSPLATRTNFDTMMSRLRKSFAEVLPQSLAGRYLFRERGMVWLANCRVDALLFLAEARKGQEHFRLQQHWQAANAFSRAAALWKGEFAPGVTGEDRISAFRHKLTAALARLALTWGGHLDRINRTQAAIDIVEKALRPDPLNDSLWAFLYRLHGRHSVLQARQVANRLATVLRNEGYPEADIEQILAGVAAAP